MLYIVRSLSAGPWRTIDRVDHQGNKFGEKMLVVSHEDGTWCVDNRSVAVWPGLCVSFADEFGANYFLEAGRAGLIAVEVGVHVAFELEDDANFYVRRGLCELLSQREAEDMMEAERQRRLAMEQGDEAPMYSPDLENKGGAAAPETKKAAAPKPPAPKTTKRNK